MMPESPALCGRPVACEGISTAGEPAPAHTTVELEAWERVSRIFPLAGVRLSEREHSASSLHHFQRFICVISPSAAG